MERTDVVPHEPHLLLADSVPGSPGTPRTDETDQVFPTAKSEGRVTAEGWARSREDVPLVVVPAEESGLTTGKTRSMIRPLQIALTTRGYLADSRHLVRHVLTGTANGSK